MENPFDKLKDKVEEYEDPVEKMAFLDGAISLSIALAEEDGEEVPEYIKDLQGVFDMLRRMIKHLPKKSE